MTIAKELLRLDVGFIIPKSVGYSREFEYHVPYVHLSPDLDLYDLTGLVTVNRISGGLLVRVKMDAITTQECVRCLADYPQSLEIDFTELYVFDPKNLDERDDFAHILPEDGKIDLAPLVREEMIIAYPIKPLCRVDCKGLCPICGENQNETICDHGDAPIDPRLEILRSLLPGDSEASIAE